MKSCKERTYPNHWLSKNFNGDLKTTSKITEKNPTHWGSLMEIRGSWLCSFVCLVYSQPCADGGGLSGAGRTTATSFWFLGLLGLISALPCSFPCMYCEQQSLENYAPAVLFKDSSFLSEPKLLRATRRCDRNRKLFCSSWGLPLKS